MPRREPSSGGKSGASQEASYRKLKGRSET